MEEERMRPDEHSALIANIGKCVSRILTERAKRDGYNTTVTWRLDKEGGKADGTDA